MSNQTEIQSINQQMNDTEFVSQSINQSADPSHSKRKYGSMSQCSPFHIAPANLTSHSPSLIDGISFKEETLMRAESADFISQMGQVLQISQWTIATAATYMHAYFAHFSMGRFDRFEVAATCLFLAGKVEERRIRVDQVIHAYYSVRLNHISLNKKHSRPSSNQSVKHAAHFGLNMPTPASDEWEAFRQRIYALEFAVLDTVEFNFELTHPYQNLMTFVRDVIFGPNYANMPADRLKKEINEKGGLAQIAWLFINDSFRSTLCLRYPPDVICVGVISLAIKFRKIPEPRPHNEPAGQQSGQRWFEELFGLDAAAIDDIERTVSESANQSYVPDYASAEHLVRAHNVSPMPSMPAPRVVRLSAPNSQSSAQHSNKKWHPRSSKRRSSSSVAKAAANVQPVASAPVLKQSVAGPPHDCDDWDNELVPAAPTRTASPSSPSPVRRINMSPLSHNASPSMPKHFAHHVQQDEHRSPNSNQSRKRAYSPYHSSNESSIQSLDQFDLTSDQPSSKVAVSLMPRFNLSDSNPPLPSYSLGDSNSTNPPLPSFSHSYNSDHSHMFDNSTHMMPPLISHSVNPSIDYSIEPTECGDWEDDDARPSPIRPYRHAHLDDPLEQIMRQSDDMLQAEHLPSVISQPVKPRLVSSYIHSELALQMSSSFRPGQCSDRSHKRQRFHESSSSPVTFC